jgi:hypothetical protein
MYYKRHVSAHVSERSLGLVCNLNRASSYSAAINIHVYVIISAVRVFYPPAGAWMFVVCVVCCQVEVRSLRLADHSSKRSPTDYGASLCVINKPRVTRRP